MARTRSIHFLATLENTQGERALNPLRCPDTIVACCTAQGGNGGALAIIRISGPNALVVANACVNLSSRKPLSDQPSHTLHHGFVVDHTGTVLDEILCAVMHAPKTFTGEHTVEITGHNNPLIIERIIAALVRAGARLAERGEFTRQAVDNKKLDLVQAEAIHDLITAPHAQGIKASLAQLSGSMSSELRTIEHQLLTAMAWCEASFEFVDEVNVFSEQIKKHLETILAHIGELHKAHGAAHSARDGFRIALVGAVNAGKSSLFNALLKKDRAIVSPTAGTTRDTIEARMVRHDMIWNLIDTAGLRATHDPIEQQGIKRSWLEAQQADILLLAIPQDANGALDNDTSAGYYEQLLSERPESVILVHTKSDLCPRTHSIHPTSQYFAAGASQGYVGHSGRAGGQDHPYQIAVSSVTKEGIDSLEQLVSERLQALCARNASPFMVNQRQYALLIQVEAQLQELIHFFDHPSIAYELVSHHLQQALEKLGEVSGKTVSEAALDKVFKDFCIGK